MVGGHCTWRIAASGKLRTIALEESELSDTVRVTFGGQKLCPTQAPASIQ